MYRQVQIIYIKQVFTQKIYWETAFDYNFLFSDANLIDNILYLFTSVSYYDWQKLQKVWCEGFF